MRGNRMYTIGIYDNCQVDMELLRSAVKVFDEDVNRLAIYGYTTSDQLMEDIDKNHDLLFINIQHVDDYQTAQEIRKKNKDVVLALCSRDVRPTSEFFKVQPFRYLMKQLSQQEMHNELADILTEMKKRANIPYIIVQYPGKIMKIRINHIIYAARKNRSTVFHVTDEEAERLSLVGEKVVRTKEIVDMSRLEEVAEKLFKHGFEYAHNSYIINFKYIIRKDKQVIKLVGNIELNCSRSRNNNFTKRFKGYLNYC